MYSVTPQAWLLLVYDDFYVLHIYKRMCVRHISYIFTMFCLNILSHIRFMFAEPLGGCFWPRRVPQAADRPAVSHISTIRTVNSVLILPHRCSSLSFGRLRCLQLKGDFSRAGFLWLLCTALFRSWGDIRLCDCFLMLDLAIFHQGMSE